MSSGTRVGTVIEDKFRLDEQIGHGSMGAVYRGTQLMVDRSVAVKLLHPDYAGHDKIQARFEVEAKAIARLNHPNCVTLYDFGYSEEMEAFYTVVEYIDGDPLEALIDRRPSIARIVELIKQVASALGHAHHHGIVHRDLKPENIMIAEMTDGSEMVKVLDFGIARIMKEGVDEEDDFDADRLTRVGEVFGTPPYMSPEQSQSTRDLTPATDLYSLGVIFYELLEGQLPFFAENALDIMSMHMNEPPPPMRRSDLPESVEEIVLKMLEKSPEKRPESGDEIVAMLDGIPDDELPDTAPSLRHAQSHTGEPTLLTSEEKKSARGVESTLMSEPPDTDAVADIKETEEIEDSGDSEIYELNELADDSETESTDPSSSPEESQAQPARASRSAATAEATAELDQIDPADLPEPDSSKATRLLGDTGTDPKVESMAASIDRHQQKMVAGVIAVLLIVGAGLAWIIVDKQLLTMANERDMTEVGDFTAGPESSSDDEDDDDSLDFEPDEFETAYDESDEESIPHQIDLSPEDEPSDDEDDDTAEEDEPGAGAPEPQPDPRPPRRESTPSPSPSPEPSADQPRPQRLDVDDEPDPPDERETEDDSDRQEQRPATPRLDLEDM